MREDAASWRSNIKSGLHLILIVVFILQSVAGIPTHKCVCSKTWDVSSDSQTR